MTNYLEEIVKRDWDAGIERNVQEALVFMMGNDDAKMSSQLTRATCLAFFSLSVQSQKNIATLVDMKIHA